MPKKHLTSYVNAPLLTSVTSAEDQSHQQPHLLEATIALVKFALVEGHLVLTWELLDCHR